MPMTEQTFHITSLDPGTTLCGRSGQIWAAPHWPVDEDMRGGQFVRCKNCDRLGTPALLTALENARKLEMAALTAFRTGWREGCGLPSGPSEPASPETYNTVRGCRDLGRRVGAEAARIVDEGRTQSEKNDGAETEQDDSNGGVRPGERQEARHGVGSLAGTPAVDTLVPRPGRA